MLVLLGSVFYVLQENFSTHLPLSGVHKAVSHLDAIEYLLGPGKPHLALPHQHGTVAINSCCPYSLLLFHCEMMFQLPPPSRIFWRSRYQFLQSSRETNSPEHSLWTYGSWCRFECLQVSQCLGGKQDVCLHFLQALPLCSCFWHVPSSSVRSTSQQPKFLFASMSS